MCLACRSALLHLDSLRALCAWRAGRPRYALDSLCALRAGGASGAACALDPLCARWSTEALFACGSTSALDALRAWCTGCALCSRYAGRSLQPLDSLNPLHALRAGCALYSLRAGCPGRASRALGALGPLGAGRALDSGRSPQPLDPLNALRAGCALRARGAGCSCEPLRSLCSRHSLRASRTIRMGPCPPCCPCAPVGPGAPAAPGIPRCRADPAAPGFPARLRALAGRQGRSRRRVPGCLPARTRPARLGGSDRFLTSGHGRSRRSRASRCRPRTTPASSSRTRAERERPAPTLRRSPRRPRRRPRPPFATPTEVRQLLPPTQPNAVAGPWGGRGATTGVATVPRREGRIWTPMETTQSEPGDDRPNRGRQRRATRSGACDRPRRCVRHLARAPAHRGRGVFCCGRRSPLQPTATTPAASVARPAIASVAELEGAVSGRCPDLLGGSPQRQAPGVHPCTRWAGHRPVPAAQCARGCPRLISDDRDIPSPERLPRGAQRGDGTEHEDDELRGRRGSPSTTPKSRRISTSPIRGSGTRSRSSRPNAIWRESWWLSAPCDPWVDAAPPSVATRRRRRGALLRLP